MTKEEILDFGAMNFIWDKIRFGTQFEFYKRYTKLKDNELTQNEYLYGELENAYQHAYASALLVYKYGEDAARTLGYGKEIFSWPFEKYSNGKTNAYLDTNRDLWNNETGIKYALNGKKQGKTIDEIADDIFNNMMKQNSDFIVNFQTDKRRWDKSSNEDNMWNIINKKIINMPISKVKSALDKIKKGIKLNQSHNTSTGFAVPISYNSGNNVNESYKDEWTYEDHLAFSEGFDSGEYGIGNKSLNYLNRNDKNDDWKKQFNVGDPNKDKGHWITMNGTHIFIKDK